MNVIKGHAVLTKTEASKGLWDTVEVLFKAIKALLDKPGSAAARASQRDQLERSMEILKSFDTWTTVEGTIICLGDIKDDKEFAVVRFEGFIEGDTHNPLKAALTAIAGTKKFNYEELTDFYEDNISSVACYNKGEFPVENLPTLVGSDFIGRLFHDLVKSTKKKENSK